MPRCYPRITSAGQTKFNARIVFEREAVDVIKFSFEPIFVRLSRSAVHVSARETTERMLRMLKIASPALALSRRSMQESFKEWVLEARPSMSRREQSLKSSQRDIGATSATAPSPRRAYRETGVVGGYL